MWNVFVECGLDFHAFEFHLQINFHVFARARESEEGDACGRVVSGATYSTSFSLSYSNENLFNTDRGEIAGAIYKQSKKIIVFDE